MSASNVATVVLAIVATLGALGGFYMWVRTRGAEERKRGAEEREMTLALKANTEATTGLTSAFHSFKEDVVTKLHSHDVRLTKVEAHIDGNPAHRNSSPV